MTDRDFLISNLSEWSNSLVFKTCQQMLPHLALVESLLTITSNHVVGCGDAEQSAVKYTFLLLARDSAHQNSVIGHEFAIDACKLFLERRWQSAFYFATNQLHFSHMTCRHYPV